MPELCIPREKICYFYQSVVVFFLHLSSAQDKPEVSPLHPVILSDGCNSESAQYGVENDERRPKSMDFRVAPLSDFAPVPTPLPVPFATLHLPPRSAMDRRWWRHRHAATQP